MQGKDAQQRRDRGGRLYRSIGPMQRETPAAQGFQSARGETGEDLDAATNGSERVTTARRVPMANPRCIVDYLYCKPYAQPQPQPQQKHRHDVDLAIISTKRVVVSASHGARSIVCCAIRLFSQRSAPMKSKESSWDGLQPAAGRLAELAQGGKVLAHVLHRWGHFPRGCNLVKGRSRKPGVKRVKIPDCGGWERQGQDPHCRRCCALTVGEIRKRRRDACAEADAESGI